MRRDQSEYQDKFWNYGAGFQQENDLYEKIVQRTQLPYDFSASAQKEETFKPIIPKISRRISKKDKFVPPSPAKSEIVTRIIIHKTGMQPEQIPLEELIEDENEQ